MSSANDAAGVQRQLADDHFRLVVETIPTQAWARSDASIEFVNQPWQDYSQPLCGTSDGYSGSIPGSSDFPAAVRGRRPASAV